MDINVKSAKSGLPQLSSVRFPEFRNGAGTLLREVHAAAEGLVAGFPRAGCSKEGLAGRTNHLE